LVRAPRAGFLTHAWSRAFAHLDAPSFTRAAISLIASVVARLRRAARAGFAAAFLQSRDKPASTQSPRRHSSPTSRQASASPRPRRNEPPRFSPFIPSTFEEHAAHPGKRFATDASTTKQKRFPVGPAASVNRPSRLLARVRQAYDKIPAALFMEDFLATVAAAPETLRAGVGRRRACRAEV
jgi:hypothetical protein